MSLSLVKQDSETGKVIGFTSDYFDGGTIFSVLPAGIYVDILRPHPEIFDEAMNHFLTRLKELKIVAKFTAPNEKIAAYLKHYGYITYTDVAGTPFYVNPTEKGIALLCGKLGLTPEQLKQQ